jgi:N4-gp56 family major capsid protein
LNQGKTHLGVQGIFRSKHFGKEIKVYHYIPLLDDRNINDQGIDATGVTI